MLRKIRLLAVGLMLAACNAFGMQHAFLLQNSGWMEPFYVDPGSQLKALVAATADVVVDASETASLLAFNQSNGANVSPLLVYQGKPGSALRAALDKVTLARKGSSQALADTDFNEAVFKTITGPFNSKPGIVWIFTNNKNSPNNSGETAARNRDFYRLIHAEPAIARSLAFPLSMPVKGRLYSASGLMVYALAYGAEADRRLQALLASGRIKNVFTQQPAQLKPLDREAVRLVPKSVKNETNISASLGKDGRTLLLDMDVSDKKTTVQLVAAVENLFYPYDISGASLKAEIAGDGWSHPLPLTPSSMPTLAPGAKADVTVSIPLHAELPNPWSPSALLQFGRQVIVPAKIIIQVDEQHLGINSAFRERMQAIFPGDPLPEVFAPPQSARSSVAEVPLQIRVNYPLYPLIVAIAAALLALLGMSMIFLKQRSGAPASFNVTVDGVPRRVTVSRFGSTPLFDNAGKQVAVIRRRGGAPVVDQVSQGHAVTVV